MARAGLAAHQRPLRRLDIRAGIVAGAGAVLLEREVLSLKPVDKVVAAVSHTPRLRQPGQRAAGRVEDGEAGEGQRLPVLIGDPSGPLWPCILKRALVGRHHAQHLKDGAPIGERDLRDALDAPIFGADADGQQCAAGGLVALLGWCGRFGWWGLDRRGGHGLTPITGLQQ